MSVATAPNPVHVPERLLTVADLAALPSQLPSGPVRYELNNGRLVIMAPPGDIHGAVELNVAARLKIDGEWKGLGKSRCGEVAIILWRDPDRVVGADAVFIANASLPIRRSSEGYLETIPDLVVEVRSKNDRQTEVAAKIQDYFTAGVKVVWDVDPGAKTITAYRRDIPPKVFTENETLTVEDIIPGFQLLVRDAFQE